MHYKVDGRKDGYILILSLSIMLLLGIVMSRLGWISTTVSLLNGTVKKREQAKQLALSGLQIAFSQLVDTKQKNKKDVQATDAQPTQKIKSTVLAAVMSNRLQLFPLKEDLDGISGEIGICISHESGKINLNSIYDFKTKKFLQDAQSKKDFRTLMQEFFQALKPFVRNQDLFGPFERYLKKRENHFNDVTELLEIPEFKEAFGDHIFYEPMTEKMEKYPLFLTDLFTCYGRATTVTMAGLSDSMAGLFKLHRAAPGQIEQRKKHFEEVFGKAKGAVSGSAQDVWNTVYKALYGKEYKDLSPLLKTLLIPAVDNESELYFTVFAYAIVEGIIERIGAIIKKSTIGEKKEQQFAVCRIYWL